MERRSPGLGDYTMGRPLGLNAKGRKVEGLTFF